MRGIMKHLRHFPNFARKMFYLDFHFKVECDLVYLANAFCLINMQCGQRYHIIMLYLSETFVCKYIWCCIHALHLHYSACFLSCSSKLLKDMSQPALDLNLSPIHILEFSLYHHQSQVIKHQSCTPAVYHAITINDHSLLHSTTTQRACFCHCLEMHSSM